MKIFTVTVLLATPIAQPATTKPTPAPLPTNTAIASEIARTLKEAMKQNEFSIQSAQIEVSNAMITIIGRVKSTTELKTIITHLEQLSLDRPIQLEIGIGFDTSISPDRNKVRRPPAPAGGYQTLEFHDGLWDLEFDTPQKHANT